MADKSTAAESPSPQSRRRTSLFRSSIAQKLAVAYVLFLLPIGYLGYQMLIDSEGVVAFAQKERAGVRYITEVQAVQDSVVRGGDLSAAATRIRANEAASHADLSTATAAEALLKVLGAGDRVAIAQAAADLIGKAADGSNLTLDTDLDSFYTQDVVTVQVPTAIAATTALASAVANGSGHDVTVADQVDIGMLSGSLQQIIDHLTSDVETAANQNADRTVQASMVDPAHTVAAAAKQAHAELKGAAQGDARKAVQPLLDALSAESTASSAELDHLLQARIARLRTGEMIHGGLGLALFLIAVAYVVIAVQRGAVVPLRVLAATMRKVAGQQLDIAIAGLGRGDEVGEMARAVEVFRQNALENERLNTAARDQELRNRRQAAMDRHTQDFSTSVSGVMASLTDSAEAMRKAAGEMSEAARRTHDSTSRAVDGATASSRDLNAVAVAAEEMAASIKEISQQVNHVTTAVHQAVQRAAETDTKVAGMAEAADRIGNVVQLITTIAGQTNLLALNATIEAARAGEAGRGFAVVAGEVKVLAAQTARATEQIGAQITAIRTATGEAVTAVRDVGGAITQVESVAAAIAAAVEQQAAATQEISGSVQNVTRATAEAAEAMQQVLGIAETTQTASRTVLDAAGDVGTTAGTLHDEVNDFLAAMARGDEERRTYERVSANRMAATLRIGKGRAEQVELQDISRGGATVRYGTAVPCGTDVQVDCAGSGPIAGRTVRSQDGMLAVSFRQDAATLARVDAVLAGLQQRAAA